MKLRQSVGMFLSMEFASLEYDPEPDRFLGVRATTIKLTHDLTSRVLSVLDPSSKVSGVLIWLVGAARSSSAASGVAKKLFRRSCVANFIVTSVTERSVATP